MAAQWVRKGWPKAIRWMALSSLLLGVTLAQAHDFGGSTNSGGNDPPPPPGPPCNSCPCTGPGGGGGDDGPGNSNDPPLGGSDKPISFYDGSKQMSVTDLVVNGVFPVVIHRKYDNQSTYDSALGYGWAFLHDRRLYEYPDNSVVVRHGCGTRDRYVLSGGSYVTPTGSMLAALSEQPDGSFQVKYLNGVTDFFDSQGRMTASSDARGNRHEYSYDARGKLPLVGASKESVVPTQPMTVAYNYRMTRIDVRGADGALTGRFVTFDYDENTGRLRTVTSDDGRTVTYEHDLSGSLTLGNLTQVNGLEEVMATYAYADPLDPHNLTSITSAPGRTPIVNTYDNQDRVTRQEEGTRRMDLVYNVPYTRTTVTKTIRDHNGLNPYTASSIYEFDTTGRVTKLTDALGHETRYIYNAAQMLTRKEIWQKDGSNLSLLQAMDWSYDGNGNKLTERVVLDSGETITRSWTYDHDWIASEQVVSSAIPSKIFRTEYSFHYGADGRPTNVQSKRRRRDDGSFQTTAYTYDARNRLLATTLPDGTQQVNEYTGDYVTRRYLTLNDQPIPQLQQEFEYDNKGNLTKRWDAQGNLTQYTYDARRRLLSVTNPMGEQFIYTYTGDVLTQIERGRTASDGEGQITRFIYDSRDRLVSIQAKNDVGVFIDTQTYHLDSEGRRIATTDASGRTMQWQFDSRGHVAQRVDAAGNTTSLVYDAAGNLIRLVDALNRETLYEYDDANRRTAIIQATASPQARTEVAYDAVGNPTMVVDPEGRATLYVYDALSRNIQVTQPLGQTVEYSFGIRDRLETYLNARGNKVTFDYEVWGALKRQRHFTTASSSTPSRTITHAYDEVGNRISTTDDGVQPTPLYSTTYDALGRVYDQTIRYIPGGDRVLRHRYDRFGNRQQLSLVDGSAVDYLYSFNKLNELTSANLAGGTVDVAHYANGQPQQITYPNGVSEAFAYELSGALDSIALNGPNGSLAHVAYDYNDVLLLASHTDEHGTHHFAYDDLDRLVGVDRPALSSLPDESYVYDRVGNRKNAASPGQWIYDANHRLTENPNLSYGYDADGNLVSRADGAVLTFDNFNRLASFTASGAGTHYVLDSSGRRIRKSTEGVDTWYLWDGASLVAEFGHSGMRTRRYAYLPGRFTPSQFQDGSGTYYVHTDQAQTPRWLTASTGELVWRAAYESYGKAAITTDVDGDGVPVAFDLRYAGQYEDSESGLYYNFFRNYDPTIGRYISADPLGLRAGMNLYAYVDGNPVNYIDPMGLMLCSEMMPLDTPRCKKTILDHNWVENGEIRIETKFDTDTVRVPVYFALFGDLEYLGYLVITTDVYQVWKYQKSYMHVRFKYECEPDSPCEQPEADYGDCEEDGTERWRLIDHTVDKDSEYWFEQGPTTGRLPPLK